MKDSVSAHPLARGKDLATFCGRESVWIFKKIAMFVIEATRMQIKACSVRGTSWQSLLLWFIHTSPWEGLFSSFTFQLWVHLVRAAVYQVCMWTRWLYLWISLSTCSLYGFIIEIWEHFVRKCFEVLRDEKSHFVAAADIVWERSELKSTKNGDWT